MNKIQELAEQAIKNHQLFSDESYQVDGYSTYVSKDIIDTFAKLIIKECLTICEDVAEDNEHAIACYYKIKGRFK